MKTSLSSTNLERLFQPATSLSGVGEKTAAALSRLGLATVRDLLWHLPSQAVHKTWVTSLDASHIGKHILAQVRVLHVEQAAKRRSHGRHVMCRVACQLGPDTIELLYFSYVPTGLLRLLAPGNMVAIDGKLEQYLGAWTMPHPERIQTLAQAAYLPEIELIYPLTYALTNRHLSQIIGHALDQLPTLPEWLDETTMQKHQWLPWYGATQASHDPQYGPDIVARTHPCIQRLAYDELLASQLALRLIRQHQHKVMGRAHQTAGTLVKRLKSALPFALTGAQHRVIEEIWGDQHSEVRMVRLLQGDVGSGKTLVALCAMLRVVEEGSQAVLMAPTDILANQHAASISKLCEPLGVQVVLLTGSLPSKPKKEALEAIASGEAQVIIGTHALFQTAVQYHDLGLVVIDEQHRFGVNQRLALADKAGHPVDILVMTATPIPRSLTLAAYGDMDISRLDEKPQSRLPIETKLVSSAKIDAVIASTLRAIASGNKVYWICPLIEEQEEEENKRSLMAVQTRCESFATTLGSKVGVIHGKMPAEQRDQIMTQFASGEIQLLIATTVIEVGIDVPDATIIVIEHAERFGLSQLHQLRGRVGRSHLASHCLLMYSYPLSEIAKARLQVMRESEDGFYLAEKDLELRGGGEVLGTKQSGLPQFRFADPWTQPGLMEEAAADARNIVANDPLLQSTRGVRLRLLLQLFGYDHATKLLQAG